MIPLSSRLENVEQGFVNLKHQLGAYEFVLGGNWDYEHGYFDRYLDEAHKVWLRIPFRVTNGTFDGETDESDAVVKLMQPLVLKHLYNEGLDAEATPRMYAAVIDQFQEPVDKDAPVADKWVRKAEELLRKVEQGMLG